MRRLLSIAPVTLFFLATVLSAAAFGLDAEVSASAEDDVCPDLDSGKIDTPSAGESLDVSVDDFPLLVGSLITQYCVKSGSVNQEDGGPVFVILETPATMVTIRHPSGQDISHYSFSVTPEPTPTPTPTPTPEPTPTPTPEPTPTPTPTPDLTVTPTPTAEVLPLVQEPSPTPTPVPAAPSDPPAAEGPEVLAVTGFRTNLAVAAVVTFILGLAFSWYARRRPT